MNCDGDCSLAMFDDRQLGLTWVFEAVLYCFVRIEGEPFLLDHVKKKTEDTINMPCLYNT